jgi:hypothetical protein
MAHGDNGPLRRFLEEGHLNYVLAVSRDHQAATGVGRRRADTPAKTLPRSAWQRRSCGHGAKGHRWYDWVLVATTSPDHHLLIRRSITKPDELALVFTSSSPVVIARVGVPDIFDTAAKRIRSRQDLVAVRVLDQVGGREQCLVVPGETTIFFSHVMNATRSAGVTDSSTTRKAMLIDSSRVIRSAGSTVVAPAPVARFHPRSGGRNAGV